MNRHIARVFDRPGIDRVVVRLYSEAQYLSLRLRNIRLPRVAVGYDGLPVPPRRLIFLMSSVVNERWFLEGGQRTAAEIRGVLGRHGVRFDELDAVLDFGCGCGRVIRHFADVADRVKLHGVDYNRSPIEWCRENLPFGRFASNEALPPLAFQDETFDVIYALSVFTHFPEHAQTAWRDELGRVLRRGGHLLLTVHGDQFRYHLTPDERAVYDRGELVVHFGGVIGANQCTAYHPTRYLEQLFRTELGWKVVEHIPGAHGYEPARSEVDRSSPHDLVLLTRS